MITQDLNNLQKEELVSFYTEKVAQLQFQVLKMRRILGKSQAQEQKWFEELTTYQQRRMEGEDALQVLSESNPYYHKIKLDVQRCEIRIMELEIRLQRFTLVQKAEKITKIMALEASIAYYQGLATEWENLNLVQKPEKISRLLVDRPLDELLLDQEVFPVDSAPAVLRTQLSEVSYPKKILSFLISSQSNSLYTVS